MSDKLNPSQFKGFLGNRVLDLEATRKVKALTGITKAIPYSDKPVSEEMTKHENEALELANGPKKKKSIISKGMDKLSEALGLETE